METFNKAMEVASHNAIELAAALLLISLENTDKSDKDHGADIAHLVDGWACLEPGDVMDGVLLASKAGRRWLASGAGRLWLRRVIFEASLVSDSHAKTHLEAMYEYLAGYW